MSTMIVNPTEAEKGSDQRTSQGAGMAVTGAATGASVGTAIVPGIGTAIGAVVGGVVGLAAGLVTGNMGDASELYGNKANAWATVGKEREAAVARRDYVREFRMRRAMAMMGIGAEEGGTRSSAPAGSVSALGNQFGFGMNYQEAQSVVQRKYSKNMNKAKKFGQASENTFAMFDAAFSAVGTAASIYGSRPKAPSSGPQLSAHGPYRAEFGGYSGNSYGPSWTENYLSSITGK